MRNRTDELTEARPEPAQTGPTHPQGRTPMTKDQRTVWAVFSVAMIIVIGAVVIGVFVTHAWQRLGQLSQLGLGPVG